MPETANPYIAGSPVTGEEMFFGREDVFAAVRQALTGRHRDHVLVLYGQRRTGKTSALYQMHRHLGPRYLCIFVDLHGLALNSLDGFLWELANHISRSLRRDYQLEVPRPERAAFMEDPRANFQAAFLERVLATIGERHLLLMLDEAVRLEEQVKAGKLEPAIFEYLRHLMQHYPRLNFLFSLGSGLEEMEKEYAFLFNVALYQKISFLDRRSALDLITRPVEGLYQVEADAVERIIQLTSAHPYFIQLICHSLFNYCQNHALTTVQVRDVEAVLDETVERGLAVLKYVWEESSPAEKAVLAALAATDTQRTPATIEQLNETWDEQGVAIPRSELARAIRSLVARDVITGAEEYAFTVDLQRRWVQKYRRLAWVHEEIEPAGRRWERQVAQAPAEPAPLPEKAWWRRPGLVLGLLLLFLAGAALIATSLNGLPLTLSPSESQVNASPAGVVIPGGDATLVNDLQPLGEYVWAATDGGLLRWRLSGWDRPGGALLIHGDQIGLPDNCINTVTADPEGNLWLGCGGVASVRPQGESVVTLNYFDRDNGLDMGAVRALVVDGQGRIWAGGLSTSNGDPALNYYDGQEHPDGLAWQSDAALNRALADLGLAPNVSSLLAGQDGELWIGLEEGSILRWDGSRLEQFPLPAAAGVVESLSDRRVSALLQDPAGRLWAAASDTGLFRFDEAQGDWVPVDHPELGGSVKSIAHFSHGTLWVGGNGAVATSSDGGANWTPAGEGLEGEVAALVEDALGQVWAGTYGGGVSVYQEQRWVSLQR